MTRTRSLLLAASVAFGLLTATAVANAHDESSSSASRGQVSDSGRALFALIGAGSLGAGVLVLRRSPGADVEQ
jgi:hypothetical protein